ncbi:MAG: hypothetical protein P8X68_12480 [Desulfobacterales bacterium]|jgi:hypothetical protein
MPFKLFAPDGLECMAAAIQCFEFGGIRPFTAQITPLYFFPFYPDALGHVVTFFNAKAKLRIDTGYYSDKCLKRLKLEVPKVVESLCSTFLLNGQKFLNFSHFSAL